MPRAYRQKIGRMGEDEAVRYLQNKGFRVIERNYRSGRGEIDIIGMDDDVLVFVEVKTRTKEGFGEPEDSVDLKKQNQICKIAVGYLQSEQIYDRDCRFDVISVKGYGKGLKIVHIKDAFWLDVSEQNYLL